LKQINE